MTRTKTGAEATLGAGDFGLTTQEVEQLLGLTERHVRRMVADGTIRATKDPTTGRLVYDPVALVRLAIVRKSERPLTPAEVQVRAFTMFEERRPILEILEATGLVVEKLRALYDEWRTPLGQRPRRLEDEERARRELEDEERRHDESLEAMLARSRAAREAAERELDEDDVPKRKRR